MVWDLNPWLLETPPQAPNRQSKRPVGGKLAKGFALEQPTEKSRPMPLQDPVVFFWFFVGVTEVDIRGLNPNARSTSKSIGLSKTSLGSDAVPVCFFKDGRVFLLVAEFPFKHPSKQERVPKTRQTRVLSERHEHSEKPFVHGKWQASAAPSPQSTTETA